MKGATVTSSEENILAYPGKGSPEYNVLIHEFAHGIHLLGLNTLDPTFDERLQITYEAAMKKGLWQGTYASSNRREYWAESTQTWFHPNSPGSFRSLDPTHHTTRQALKEYDPELATLLTEVYGDREWRYTPIATRTHLLHLQGFDPQNSPTFQGWPELEALHRQMSDPNSDGDGRWVDLKPYDPSELPRLTKLDPINDLTTIIFVNFTETEVLFYEVYSDGIEHYTNRYQPGQVGGGPIRINQVLLVKDAEGKNIAAFQAIEKTGRALIGIASDETNRVAMEDSDGLKADVNGDGIVNIQDLVLVASNLGQTGQNIVDVNGDGLINIQDLVLVAGALGASAAAPALNAQVLSAITAVDVKLWLSQAQSLTLTDTTSQRGVLFLEQLLAALTPKETSLLPNYPNPFNPETWIPYQLAEPADVTLCIYAVDGSLIRALSLGHKPIGIYQTRSRAAYWDGRNELGEPVTSGVYFYTLSTKNFTSTRKMLILK